MTAPLTSELRCTTCHQLITDADPGTWGIACSNAMHLRCKPTSNLVVRDGYGWVRRGDGLEYTATDAEYVREIERLRAGLQLIAADEHRLMNVTARQTAESILAGKPIHADETSADSKICHWCCGTGRLASVETEAGT
jgi:hypothetical protein